MSLTLAALGASAVGGAALGLYGKAQENETNMELLSMKKRQLAERRLSLERAQKLATAEESSALNAATKQSSMANKNAAIEAFQNESAQGAAVGASGTVGGTAFFNLAKTIVNNKEALADASAIGAEQLKGMELGFLQTDNQFNDQRNQLDWEGEYLALESAKLDYANSPLSYFMSVASGGFNGLSMGASVMSTFDRLSAGGKAKAAVAPESPATPQPAATQGQQQPTQWFNNPLSKGALPDSGALSRLFGGF